MGIEQDHNVVQELRYFGRVTASISHELKNVLAILNENAGLLQDLCAMVNQGQPLDVTRVQKLSTTMQKQIGRGDKIIKRMNRFAHSVDHDCESVNLHELVTIVVALFERIATTRGITIEVMTGTSGVTVKTNPFALEALVGTMLDRLTAEAPAITRHSIDVSSHNTMGQIRLQGLVKQVHTVARVLDSDDLKALLGALHAKTDFRQETGELFIMLPDNITA